MKSSSSKRSKTLHRLADLIRADAQPGHIDWIGLCPGRREAMKPVREAPITVDGLIGDRGRAGKRAVTLFQSEHIDVVASFVGNGPIQPERLRRNIHVRALNLSALRGVPLRIGTAVLEITAPCAPCSRMQEELGVGGYNAMRGHGGWCAVVHEPGVIALDNSVARV